MLNLYSTIKNSILFNRIEVNELLFAEYTCMRDETRFGIWSDNNYFAFISSGKKAWKTTCHTYEVSHGDILFIKKGANLTHQFFDDTFCAIFIFIPDDFIRSFLRRNSELLTAPQTDVSDQDAVLRIEKDELLETYHHSVASYLSLTQKPAESLLLLKFEELLLSLFAHERHRPLTDYFVSLCRNPHAHLSRVMEANFAYNLKLEDYARLCNMSLSTFKNAFKRQYHFTPAAWLLQKKLELARQQMLSTDFPVTRIALECGFEDTSHFIRVFKQKYQLTPLQFRLKQNNVSH